MDLPKLAHGKRFALPLPPGSADAMLLAELASREAAQGRIVAVVTADAVDAQRLCEEIAFFAPQLRCVLFPDWETLPFDTFSPHQDLISERLSTLWRIRRFDPADVADVVLLSATSALHRLAPPSFLAGTTFHFAVKQKLAAASLKEQLTLAGYRNVTQVLSPGEYTVRGGLIDLFPMGSPVPYRIDLFDDDVDSIRIFDPDTQRSAKETVQEVRLLPGHEFPMDEEARKGFRSRWRETFEGDPSRSQVYQDISKGIAVGGIEYYLPLFFDDTATIFDYLGADATVATVVLHGDIPQAIAHFWKDIAERHRMAGMTPHRPVLPPGALFLSGEQFYERANRHAQLALRPGGDAPAAEGAFHNLGDVSVTRGAEDPMARLRAHIQATPHKVLLLAESEGRRSSLLDILHSAHIEPVGVDALQDFLRGPHKLGIAVCPLARGFSAVEQGVDFVTETELYRLPPAQRRRKKQEQVSDVEALVRDLSELRPGDPVVHIAHGIGRYRGLITMDVGSDKAPRTEEFLHIEYADQACLYVPVGQLHLIGRYTGVAAEEAPLHRLGSPQWEKAKRKAAQQVRDSAAELLDIYARRAAREGHAFRMSAQDFESFCADFGFEETPDQLAAIHAVVADLCSPRPMDRLVCGDVGFGKTEVALRAAFIAVMGGKQVAILTPTTLLAEQHYQTIVDRFARWPVKVAELSRFRSAKENAKALQGLADGTIDIAVGTHKLLSQDVRFQDLGLLIIDEEHRFGVRHKEKMKAMRAEVDVLTLTATPIPRTMGMALEGLRDLSVIATAPQRRLAIKTFVRDDSESVIREAVLRELLRGGQVYFLHNEVATIEDRRSRLEKLVPEARIAVAHGQMPERQLEGVMRDFVAQRSNLLLCSTIIETGIDVPSANTIVISRADKFGLAQLHQLRGRVGRSHHQAYAYLMIPEAASLGKQARQRLDAIVAMEELGSGFYLAMHDLEIRGAGEVLGENQSGNMMEIGFQLYSDMLAEAVRCLREGKEPDLLAPLHPATEINLHAPTLLPTEYCDDIHLRLGFYKKLASAKAMRQIDAVVDELSDRFGPLPEAAQTLVASHRLRIVAEACGVRKIDASPEQALLTFGERPAIDLAKVVRLLQSRKDLKLDKTQTKLWIAREVASPQERAQLVRDTLRSIADDEAARTVAA